MGGTDLRMGVSGAKFDAEDDFEVRLALAPPKLGQIEQKQIGEFSGSKNCFFAILAGFLRSYGQMDLKIRFSVKFCSRYTFPEVCATKNHENDVKTAKIIALNSPP